MPGRDVSECGGRGGSGACEQLKREVDSVSDRKGKGRILVGTTQWLAPELFQGAKQSTATDV